MTPWDKTGNSPRLSHMRIRRGSSQPVSPIEFSGFDYENKLHSPCLIICLDKIKTNSPNTKHIRRIKMPKTLFSYIRRTLSLREIALPDRRSLRGNEVTAGVSRAKTYLPVQLRTSAERKRERDSHVGRAVLLRMTEWK